MNIHLLKKVTRITMVVTVYENAPLCFLKTLEIYGFLIFILEYNIIARYYVQGFILFWG